MGINVTEGAVATRQESGYRFEGKGYPYSEEYGSIIAGNLPNPLGECLSTDGCGYWGNFLLSPISAQ